MGKILTEFIDSWGAGVITSAEPDAIPKDALAKAYNTELTYEGTGKASLSKRRGFVELNATPITGTSGIIGQFEYKRIDSGVITPYHLLFSSTGRIDSTDTVGTGPTVVDATAFGIGNYFPDFAQANNEVFYCNGQETGKVSKRGGVLVNDVWGIVAPATAPILWPGSEPGPSVSASPSGSPSGSPSSSPSGSPSGSESGSPSGTPSSSPSGSPSNSPSSSPSGSTSGSPSGSPSNSPSETPSITASPSPSPRSGLHHGTYEGRVTFYNSATGQESSAGPTSDQVVIDEDSIDWFQIPVSTDPQVTGRRLYLRNVNTMTNFYLAQLVNNASGVQSMTNISDTALIDVGPDTDENNPPVAGIKYCCWHKSRMFAATDSELFYSKIGNPESFDPNYYVLVAKDEGQNITGLFSAFGTLFVFKTNSVYAITGDDPDEWIVSKVIADIGCVSFRSIVAAENTLYWWSEVGPVQWTGDGKPSPIGMLFIEPDIQTVLAGVFNIICGAADIVNQRIVWSIPVGDVRNNRMLPFNYRLQRWESNYWDPVDACSLIDVEDSNGIPWLMAGGYSGQVFKLGTGYIDGVPSGDVTGTFTASGTTTGLILTIPGKTFRTTGGSLTERYVTVVDADGAFVARRRILSNTANTLTIGSAITVVNAAVYTIYIGGPYFEFDTPWSSMTDQFFNGDFAKKRYEFLMIDTKATVPGYDLYVALAFDKNPNFGQAKHVSTAGQDSTWNATIWSDASYGTKADRLYKIRIGRTGVWHRTRIWNYIPNQSFSLRRIGVRAEFRTYKIDGTGVTSAASAGGVSVPATNWITGGSKGELLYCNPGATAGMEWLDTAAKNYELISNGVGEIPSWRAKAFFNIKDYGAVVDGTTDDTAAVQAAIDAAEAVGGGMVFFPGGICRCNSGLTCTSSNVSFFGTGRGATLIYAYQASGDFLYIHGTGTLQRVQISNLSIYSQAEATSGALVHFDRVNHCVMSDVELTGYFGGLLLESVVHSEFMNLDIGSDANFTGAKANSYLIQIVKNASGSIPSELHFTNLEARGQNGNNYLSNGIWIRNLDGAFFTNLHVGFCQYPLLVQPLDNSAQLSGLSINNFFLDTAQYWGGYFVQPSGSYTGVCGANVLADGHIYNTGLGGIGMDIATTAPTLLNAIEFQAIDTHGIQITEGNDVLMSDLSMWDINRDGVGACGVQIETDVNRFTINGLTVRQGGGTAPAAAIYVATGCDDYRISDVTAEGCTYTVSDASTTTDRSYGPCQSDLNMLTQTAGVGGELDLPHGHTAFLLGTTYNVSSISARSAFKGRMISLIAAGTVTVVHGNNLKLGGSNVVMAIDDCITLVHNGTNWVKV